MLLLGLSFQLGISQALTSTAGKTMSAGAYQLSWSLGEPMINTYAQTHNTLTQGFHQPEIQFNSLPAATNPRNTKLLTVFPNPTSGLLKIKLDQSDPKGRLVIYNLLGDEIEIKPVPKDSWSIDISEYQPGVYLLKYTSEQGEFDIIRIIKE